MIRASEPRGEAARAQITCQPLGEIPSITAVLTNKKKSQLCPFQLPSSLTGLVTFG